MTDDIVTRLRHRAEERQEALDEYWRGHKFGYDFPMLESQAADEIEYLRKDRDKWKRLAIENDKIAQIQAGIYPPIPHYEEVNKHE